jgi:hypothetical protein
MPDAVQRASEISFYSHRIDGKFIDKVDRTKVDETKVGSGGYQHNKTGERAARLPNTIDQRSSNREPDAVRLLICPVADDGTVSRYNVRVNFGSAGESNRDVFRNERSVVLRARWNIFAGKR